MDSATSALLLLSVSPLSDLESRRIKSSVIGIQTLCERNNTHGAVQVEMSSYALRSGLCYFSIALVVSLTFVWPRKQANQVKGYRDTDSLWKKQHPWSCTSWNVQLRFKKWTLLLQHCSCCQSHLCLTSKAGESSQALSGYRLFVKETTPMELYKLKCPATL